MIMRRAAASVLVLSALMLFASLPVAACKLVAGPERSVARAIDAETLLLDDQSEVRLIGALAPRASDVGAEPGQWPPEQAARVTLETLAVGRTVRLRFDTTRRDRHGVTLAQVYIVEAGKPEIWLQGAMLEAGHARAYALAGQRTCIDDLMVAEAKARAAGLGLWREAAYRVRPASERRDLVNFAGSFQIVDGVAGPTWNAQGAIRLALGPDRRRDVTAIFRADDRDLLARLGGDLKALAPSTALEVRGWLEQRTTAGSLDIDISKSGHVALK